MVRTIDWVCQACGHEEIDALASEDAYQPCIKCHAMMSQRWWGTRKRYAQWSDADAVLVHMTDDPSVPEDRRIRYVGSHEAKLKAGYRRVYLRNLQEVNRFEKEHRVANHVMHYDSNGRDISDWNVGSH